MKVWIDDIGITTSRHKDARGLNHYGVHQYRRYKEVHTVDQIMAEIRPGKYGQQMTFYVKLDGPFDLQVSMPINVIGGLARQMVELAKNFQLTPMNLQL